MIKCADTTLDDGEGEGDDEGGIGDVPCWLINPHSGGKTYLIICLSHQVKHNFTYNHALIDKSITMI